MTDDSIREKKLKDPIYGYIAIRRDVVEKIIDTATFQRLRRIAQTSYAPVYASAVHNRFVHSLGVYHLGRVAGTTLKTEVEAQLQKKGLSLSSANLLDSILETFLLACLLHDVGHSPFSHTGEDFFAAPGRDVRELHEKLKKVVKDKKFELDVPARKNESAKPHEIVSAIVGLKEYPRQIEKGQADFFARCITGYKYQVPSLENSIRNCFIQLLNSSLIDVDKLDYLIRDAYITGYETIKIDYVRLLTCLTVTVQDATFSLAYKKGAMSVIENVVYAHDLERKWIQTHPVILYENFLLTRIFAWLSKKYDTAENHLFSVEALSRMGVQLNHGKHIRLFCDDDIISLMKENIDADPLFNEYFERSLRRHPVWKSEAEYRLYFEKRVGTESSIYKEMIGALGYLANNPDTCVIDNKLVEELNVEIHELKNNEDNQLPQDTLNAQLNEKKFVLETIYALLGRKSKRMIGKNESCVLLKATQFSSGFHKFRSGVQNDIKIVLPSLDSQTENTLVVSFNDLVVSLEGRENKASELFYLYSKSKLSVIDISNSLISSFAK